VKENAERLMDWQMHISSMSGYAGFKLWQIVAARDRHQDRAFITLMFHQRPRWLLLSRATVMRTEVSPRLRGGAGG